MAMAQERGLKVDQKGFDKLMKKQREGSKSSSMFKVLDIAKVLPPRITFRKIEIPGLECMPELELPINNLNKLL